MGANIVERIIEKGLFASRWIMAPFYIGLSLSLGGLLFSFIQEFWHFITILPTSEPNQVILAILSLIDLSLAGNLMLIVIFSGYENFVSNFDISDHEDQPDWKGTVDFATLKLKLISSIVAISGIHLLRIFMSNNVDQEKFQILLIAHVVFVASGVLLALMDFISSKTKSTKAK